MKISRFFNSPTAKSLAIAYQFPNFYFEAKAWEMGWRWSREEIMRQVTVCSSQSRLLLDQLSQLLVSEGSESSGRRGE